MNRKIHPVTSPIQGSVKLPNDQFLSLLTLAIAATTKGESKIFGLGIGKEIELMKELLGKLGTTIRQEREGIEVVSSPGRNGFSANTQVLNAQNSITILKLLVGIVAGSRLDITISANKPASDVSLRPFTTPIEMSGAWIILRDRKYPPIRIISRPMRGISYRLTEADCFTLAGLILAASAGEGRFQFTPPHTVDPENMTAIFSQFGANIYTGNDQRSITIDAPVNFTNPNTTINSGDTRHGLLAIAAACSHPGSQITIENLAMYKSTISILEKLRQIGVEVKIAKSSSEADSAVPNARVEITVPEHELASLHVDFEKEPVLAEYGSWFALIALFAGGESKLYGLKRLNSIEHTRIQRFIGNIKNHGIECSISENECTIHGGQPIEGGDFFTHNDPWLASLLVIAGFYAHGTTIIDNQDIIDEFYPRFFPIMAHLGATKPKRKKHIRINHRKKR